MARTHEVTIEVYSDVVGKPYVKISTYERDGATGTASPSHDTTIWAEKMTLSDHRRPRSPKP